MSSHESGEEYAGAAVVAADGTEVEVQVDLRSTFQPIDGRLHWYGRVAATEALQPARAGSVVELRTQHGSAQGRLSDLDPWGRFRITGVGRPPF
jgi:hypothetical protein